MLLSRAFSLGSASFLAVLLAVTGCGSSTSSDAQTRELVGHVDGTGAFIGIVMEGDHALAYVCDGTDAATAVATWMDGPSSGTDFDLEASGVHVRGALAGDRVSGRVVLADGSAHDFSTAPVTGTAGVYRDATSSDAALGRSIVLGDGTLRGALRVDGSLLAVTSSVTSGGVVTATTGGLTLTGTRLSTSRPAPSTTTPDAGTTCSAATTCNGHGLCSATGTCGCTAAFTGATCNACAPGFFGYPLCKFCSATTTCSGHGTCDASGNCACNPGFSGPTCQ